MVKEKLSLPKRIALPETFLFIFNPVVFLILTASGIALVIMNSLSPFSLAIVFSVLGLLVLARRVFVEFLVDNVILACGLLSYLFGRRYIAWKRQVSNRGVIHLNDAL